MRKKLVVDVPDDVFEVELRHPSGVIEDVEVDGVDEDEEDDEDEDDDDE